MKKIIILLIVLIALTIPITIYLLKDNNTDNKVTYIKGITHTKVASDTLENEANGILKNYNEYISFIKLHNINQELNENDFDNNNYLYYVIEIDSCSENIIGVSNLQYKDKTALITFDIERKCGVCAPIQEVYIIPITKEKDINKIDVEYNTIKTTVCDQAVAYKPILYLYPEKETKVTVKLEHPETLLTTYPKYQDGWKVTVKENGDMYDNNNNYYYALYWDELTNNNIDFKEGFYVEKDNAITFLEEKLNIIGLSPKEKNEFIMYWLPIIEQNEKNIIYFEQTEELEKNNKLIITPKPDTLLRVRIHIKKVNKIINIREQQLISCKRVGFTAVEWGGVIHN